jgi:hypothetical protein
VSPQSSAEVSVHSDAYMALKTNISVLQVSLYMDKFAGVCQSVLHDCKLTFLQIICDHDLFVEMPGRDPSDRYSLFLM